VRQELAEAAGGIVNGMREVEPEPLDDHERGVLLAAADLVTLARTGVDFEHRGDVIDAYAPEMPTSGRAR
jgi:hypothetical protein